MPGMQAHRDRGPVAVFTLGAFSGTASACCAPVLAGVVALSGAASSFLAAAAVGTAYVFGMVAPLFLLATLWDRYDWGDSRLLRGRTFTIRLPGRSWSVHSTTLAGGVLLIAMGGLTAVVAFTGVSMPRRGWEATLTARLGHYGAVVSSWLSGIPGWVSLIVIFTAVGLLAWKAIGQYLDTVESDDDPGTPPDADGEQPVEMPTADPRPPSAPPLRQGVRP